MVNTLGGLMTVVVVVDVVSVVDEVLEGDVIRPSLMRLANITRYRR